jgi:hypothetical protein
MLAVPGRPAIVVAVEVLAVLAPQPLRQPQGETAVPGEHRQSQALSTLVAAAAGRSVRLLVAEDRVAAALDALLVLRAQAAPRPRAAVAVAAAAAQTSQAAAAAAESLF